MRTFKKKGAKAEPGSHLNNVTPVLPHGDLKQTKPKSTKEKFACIIRLLDDSQKPIKCNISKDDPGQIVFAFVCSTIGDLVECDYFGLRYRDKYDQEQWLDLSKSVYKQVKRSKSPELCFRLKHYPSDPVRDLKQSLTRYLVYLQIRRDLLHGRLACPSSMVANIGALIAQAEFGDAPTSNESTSAEQENSSESESRQESSTELDAPSDYLHGFPIFCSQTVEDELAIMKRHEQLRGLTAQEAEVEVLNRVSTLPTYGIVPFSVKPHHKIDVPDRSQSSAEELKSSDKEKIQRDQSSDRKFNLGISENGLVLFAGLKKVQQINWADIHRLTCDGKNLIVHPKKEKLNLFKRLLRNKHKHFVFECETSAAALALWRWAVDRKCFFTLKESKEAKRLRPNSSLFHRNQTYRFSGRSFMELSATPIKNTQAQFVRVSSMRSAQTPECTLPKHATLPSRLRPLMNMPEETQVLDQTEPDRIPTKLIVPSTVLEQGVERTSVRVLNESQLNGMGNSGTGDTDRTVEEPLIETSIAMNQQHAELSGEHVDCKNSRDGSAQPDYEDPGKGMGNSNHYEQDLRLRVDTDLIESVVYKQVVSEFDVMLENHADAEANAFPNSGAERNGLGTRLSNGSVKRNASIAENDQKKPYDSNDRMVDYETLAFKSDTKVTIALTVVVLLVGAIVVLETSSNGNNPASRFLRNNAIVSAFDSYIYSPVRDFVAHGLSLFWS